MSKRIKELYRKAGLTPPKGKGIHTERAHRAVIRYLKKGLSKEEAWKRVIGGMGKYAIKKSHQRTTKSGAKKSTRRKTKRRKK